MKPRCEHAKALTGCPNQGFGCIKSRCEHSRSCMGHPKARQERPGRDLIYPEACSERPEGCFACQKAGSGYVGGGGSSGGGGGCCGGGGG